MYIEYEDFEEFNDLIMESEYKMFSPGWVAQYFGVTRQAVNNWINRDIIDAYRCVAGKGQLGHYVLISESEYAKIESFRKNKAK